MQYMLEAESGGYSRASNITETEDVSYVSSAYVPQCLRHGGRPTLSNAHRAHESGATNATNIRDDLEEIITLNSVSIIVTEYVPFGANHIVQLNQNLGSFERVQGGFFTALVDDNPSSTRCAASAALSRLRSLSAAQAERVPGPHQRANSRPHPHGPRQPGGRVRSHPACLDLPCPDRSPPGNSPAARSIHYPEAPGIVQVETFGVSLNANGSAFYGMQVRDARGPRRPVPAANPPPHPSPRRCSWRR